VEIGKGVDTSGSHELSRKRCQFREAYLMFLKKGSCFGVGVVVTI
jgi:hypothetical protein